MKTIVSRVRELCKLQSDREALGLLALSALGWAYYGYYYLYESGLGIAIPRYAGY